MKKIFLLIRVFFCCLQLSIFSIQAQTLYGTTSNGGSFGGGTITKFLTATNKLIVVKSFESIAAYPYYGNFIQANDGKLYGMTSGGGSSDNGVIFSFDPVSFTCTVLKDFDGADGAKPYGSLIQASDGKLYGMTTFGGSNYEGANRGAGVIFSYDPSSSTYTKLKDFDDSTGKNPYGSLLQASDGKLYGMAAGGSSHTGVIFSYDFSSSTYTKLKDFVDTIGTNPFGSLIQANDGKLYGMTESGGTSSAGVIFSYDPSSSTFTKLKDFGGGDGAYPVGRLMQASDGKLYGLTSGGGNKDAGVIFSFDRSTSAYKKLKDFDGKKSGSGPYGSLIQASDGKLYGMTEMGGSSDKGIFFSFDPSSSTFTKLKDFGGTDGTNPYGSLIQANDGKFYGMTSEGGNKDAGVIFSFDPSSSSFTNKDVGTNETGRNASANLTLASDRKLYGITTNGGSNGYGVIFSFDPYTFTYKKLKDFDVGGHPEGSLIQASDGKLYGMTWTRDDYGVGDDVIFSFDPSSSTYTKLKDFYGGHPGGLIQASDGKLYGVTAGGYIGESYNDGVIFSFDPSSSTYKELKDVDNEYNDGNDPSGSLIQASDGKLYGMTGGGGRNGSGVIFSFDPSSSIYTKLKDFDGINGAHPQGNLIQASDGMLYGMTSGGGSSGRGVIFSFDPSSSTYKKLKDFTGTDGANASGSLFEASDGWLYGMTSGGGDNGKGVIFSFDPFSSTYTKLTDYSGANGAAPSSGAAFIELHDSIINKRPKVILTTPADSSFYNAGADISFEANATDPDGTIRKVEFYNGSSLLYSDTVAPYTFDRANVPAGTYTLFAKATDNGGRAGTSPPVTVIVLSAGAHVTLYGTTFSGGNFDLGTINKFIPATNSLTVVKSFDGVFPANPRYTNFIQANDGKLYGMTFGGGTRNSGVIFSFDPSTSTNKMVKSFDYTKGGAYPYGSLMQASDGKLYGMTSGGGNSNAGVIFSFDPSTSTYTTLVDFDGIKGSSPYGSLIQAKDGKLYGMTNRGGSSDQGVIFSYDPSSFTFTKLKDFNDTIGAHPNGSLMQASDGKLYGMAGGGSSGAGVIFSFDPSTSAYTKLKDFDGTDVVSQNGSLSLIQANDGKLYGMAGGSNGSSGVIFSYDPSTSTYKKLTIFDGTNGRNPYGSLIQASDGKLYGMTRNGGISRGVIFSFDLLSSTYTKLRDFDYLNGLPSGSLMQARDGRLYGMTSQGGSWSVGGIFSFDPSSSTYTKLNDLGHSETAGNASASLIRARDGKLYGMTHGGGSSDKGVIFSFDPSTSFYKEFQDFNGKNGADPNGSLIQASDGKLYGMTTNGGINNDGVIFSFDPFTLTYKKLNDFNNTNGGDPNGSLIQASDGKLYGITTNGGINNDGVIFSFDTFTLTYKQLKNFDDTNGATPYGSLMQASNKKLYGMTSKGGSNNAGVIFSFDAVSSTYTKLKDFTNGANPNGSLIQASDGKLYGMTSGGGSKNAGVIFAYDPASSVYTNLKEFDGTNGSYPIGNLMQASDGKLYGMTNEGGSNGQGIIFSYDPSSSTFAKLKDYDGANGAAPSYSSAFIELRDSTVYRLPVAKLVTPADSSTYNINSTIVLNAAASDTDGTITKVEFYSSTTLLYTATDTPYTYQWRNVPAGHYTLIAKATDNDGLATSSAPVDISVISNQPPLVKITSPASDTNYIVPGPVFLSANASASAADGTIRSVDFYNDESTLIFTDSTAPYSVQWFPVPTGSYHITAVATDNNGGKTTSTPVHITVLHNRPPVVNITSPADSTIYVAPASIVLSADALAHGGRIKTVKFYNGTTLLHTEENRPYLWEWKNVRAGIYTITAKATDTYDRTTISAPVTAIVASPGIPVTANRFSATAIKTGLTTTATIQLLPNPAHNILNIYTTGFQKNKRSTISVISSSGVTLQTKKLNNPIAIGLTSTIQLNVSSLAGGVYTIKMVSGDKIMYKQFVKL